MVFGTSWYMSSELVKLKLNIVTLIFKLSLRILSGGLLYVRQEV